MAVKIISTIIIIEASGPTLRECTTFITFMSMPRISTYNKTMTALYIAWASFFNCERLNANAIVPSDVASNKLSRSFKFTELAIPMQLLLEVQVGPMGRLRADP